MESTRYQNADVSTKRKYISQNFLRCEHRLGTTQPTQSLLFHLKSIKKPFLSTPSSHTMHLMQHGLVSLAIGVAIVLASSPFVLVAPGAQIRALPVTTFVPVADNFSWENGVVIQRHYRSGQPAQKPLNGCAEIFCIPTLDCSVCGREDPYHPRSCSKPTCNRGWMCACKFSFVIRSPKLDITFVTDFKSR
jgi:hypothetical protein